MSIYLRASVVVVVSTVCLAAAWGDARPPRTTFDSVYSAAQATRGKDKFTLVCLSCHDMDEHKAILREVWVGKPLAEFYNYLVTEMPSGDPGTLSRQEYSDVTAYLLQLNGMPAGEVELPTIADSLATIRIDTVATAPDSTTMPKDSVATDTLATDSVATDTVGTDTLTHGTSSARHARSPTHVPAWLRTERVAHR